jgi:hypothetical protein
VGESAFIGGAVYMDNFPSMLIFLYDLTTNRMAIGGGSGSDTGGSSSATACFHRIRMDSYHMKRNGWLI